MTRTDLRLAIGASSSTFAKLSRGEFISGDLTARICKALNCNVGDMRVRPSPAPQGLRPGCHLERLQLRPVGRAARQGAREGRPLRPHGEEALGQARRLHQPAHRPLP